MRYYSLVLNTTSEMIEEAVGRTLKGFGYDNAIASLNIYMYKNLKNGLVFFAYREEENAVLTVFSYDEKTTAFAEAYEYIRGVLGDVFDVKQVKSEPVEITMFQCNEHYLEARRRGYAHMSYKIVESLNIDSYNDANSNERRTFKYNLDEKIISEKRETDNPMFDASVINELANIESHKIASDFNGNMVHYFISSKSVEAASDITDAIVRKLAQANRISGRRMEIISGIDPEIFLGRNYIEDIIENNYGGVMVMDLSCKLECESTQYSLRRRR